MRFAGIDIASERHVVALVDERGEVLLKATEFQEDLEGYQRLFGLLGSPKEILVAMEATGHYWRNLFAALSQRGFDVALLNPRRTHAFAAEALERTKTDAIDALSIARFAKEKRPAPTRLREAVLEEVRELSRLRESLTQAFGDKTRELHRLVDLCFPEFTRQVKTLDSMRASAILAAYPTAERLAKAPPRKLAKLCYDGRHKVGDELALSLVEAAKCSVAAHKGAIFEAQVRFACEDLDTLRRRLKEIEADLEAKLSQHELGTLLSSIDGLGLKTTAVLLAEVGDPALFESAKALSAYVGAVPGLKQSGKSKQRRAPLTSIGNRKLRCALYMPTLAAVQHNPWLRAHYQALVARGKPKKVALIACMNKLVHAVYSVAKNRKPFELRMATKNP